MWGGDDNGKESNKTIIRPPHTYTYAHKHRSEKLYKYVYISMEQNVKEYHQDIKPHYIVGNRNEGNDERGEIHFFTYIF